MVLLSEKICMHTLKTWISYGVELKYNQNLIVLLSKEYVNHKVTRLLHTGNLGYWWRRFFHIPEWVINKVTNDKMKDEILAIG